MKYIMHWRSEITNSTGHNDSALPEAFARKHVDKLNAANKGKINYWLVPVEESNELLIQPDSQPAAIDS